MPAVMLGSIFSGRRKGEIIVPALLGNTDTMINGIGITPPSRPVTTTVTG